MCYWMNKDWLIMRIIAVDRQCRPKKLMILFKMKVFVLLFVVFLKSWLSSIDREFFSLSSISSSSCVVDIFVHCVDRRHPSKIVLSIIAGLCVEIEANILVVPWYHGHLKSNYWFPSEYAKKIQTWFVSGLESNKKSCFSHDPLAFEIVKTWWIVVDIILQLCRYDVNVVLGERFSYVGRRHNSYGVCVYIDLIKFTFTLCRLSFGSGNGWFFFCILLLLHFRSNTSIRW